MSSLCGPTMEGKRDLQRLHHVLGVVDGERRLGDEGQVIGIGRLKPCDVVHGLDQGRRALGQLAHGADDLGMAGMADEDDVAAALVVDLRLAVHLGHQRAGGVDGEEVAGVGRRRHRFGDPVGREDHRSVAFRAPRRARGRRPRPSASGFPRRICCARSRGAHRPARHGSRAPSRPHRWHGRPRRRSRAGHRAGCREKASS